MTNPLDKLPLIKAALQRHIEEADAATKAPWILESCRRSGYKQLSSVSKNDPWQAFAEIVVEMDKEPSNEGIANSVFISHARTMSPAQGAALLRIIELIEVLWSKHLPTSWEHNVANGFADAICRDWPKETV